MKNGYYAANTRALKEELSGLLDKEAVRSLHKRRPWKHFCVLLRQCLLLAVGVAGVVRFKTSPAWIPFSILEGLVIFDFTVMLHEVLHGLVFARPRPRLSRLLSLCYSVPSGISATQFTRWHLDHHSELGSNEGDPKRHHLSPKKNRRWIKLLYFTPVLFVIYFRAAARETASYPAEVRSLIARERAVAVLFQLSILASIWAGTGFSLVAKLYLVPVFLVFPVAFALNRLGQHYDIRPDDPARWSTLVKPNRFWDFVYLWSNYHLEHHYFPGIPFYNLPQLHRVLKPFFRGRGMIARGYGELLYGYIVLNKAPHTNWEIPRSG